MDASSRASSVASQRCGRRQPPAPGGPPGRWMAVLARSSQTSCFHLNVTIRDMSVQPTLSGTSRLCSSSRVGKWLIRPLGRWGGRPFLSPVSCPGVGAAVEAWGPVGVVPRPEARRPRGRALRRSRLARRARWPQVRLRGRPRRPRARRLARAAGALLVQVHRLLLLAPVRLRDLAPGLLRAALLAPRGVGVRGRRRRVAAAHHGSGRSGLDVGPLPPSRARDRLGTG